VTSFIERLKKGLRHGGGRSTRGEAITPLRPIDCPVVDEDNHPESAVLAPYCVGRGIDVGCGHRKVTEDCIGVDILAPAEVGEHGVVQGRTSVADVKASGDDLHMFADGELDFVVSRHNLEHYIDLVKVLSEWKRVLHPGGTMAMVVPDERAGDTVFLDPTHKHCFTPESLEALIGILGGFEQVTSRVVVPDWSFLAVAVRTDDSAAGQQRA
jgi:SAM-dependent methyltransferase